MWYLILNNLKGRKLYNSIIVVAVSLAITVALSAAFMTSSLQKELEHKQLLLGPELAIVPPGTKEGGHLYLTKGPPRLGCVPQSAVGESLKFKEVEAVSAQRLLGDTLVESEQAMLIAFDFSTDFMVRPWLDKRNAKELQLDGNTVLLGVKLAPGKKIGESIELAGKNYIVAGRLQDTGSFMDSSIFLPKSGNDLGGVPSWILIGIKQGSSVDLMINKIETNIASVEVIARPEMLKTINDQLHGVVKGGGFNAAAILVVIGALLVTGAMFSLLVYERRREFGLLKSMGAKNSFVFKLIVGEALVLGSMGAVLGLVLSSLWLIVSGTQVLPSGADTLAGLGYILGRTGLVFVLTSGIAVLAAIFPALFVARMEAYAAIRTGE